MSIIQNQQNNQMNQMNFNIQETKEIELKIWSKERQERKQEKIINIHRRYFTRENKTFLTKTIFLFLLGIIFKSKEGKKSYKRIENKEEKTKNSLMNISNDGNRIESNSYLDNSDNKKQIEDSKFIIVNTDSFTILKTSWRLYYSRKAFYIIILLNIFLPGFGTVVDGIGWGKTYIYKDRTYDLITKGIFQFLTFFLIYGWIQSIWDASTYFEDGFW